MKRDYEAIKIKDYFFSRIVKTPTCWFWTGYITPFGYGQMMRNKRVHRISYEIHKGKIPKGLFVCHSCDNRNCVNPDHLFLGTHLDNIRDMNNKHRVNISGIGKGENRGEKCGSAKLKEIDVLEIREKLKTCKSQRSLSKELKIPLRTLNDIHLRKTWKHI